MDDPSKPAWCLLPDARSGTSAFTLRYFPIQTNPATIFKDSYIANPDGSLSIGGTASNNNAAAGYVGETVQSLVAVGSAVSLTTATATNVTSISLTAGDWDVSGNCNFTNGSTTLTASVCGISSTSATLPTDGSEAYSGLQTTTTSTINSITMPRKRISIASTTTVYLVGKTTFSAGTSAEFGGITARRVR